MATIDDKVVAMSFEHSKFEQGVSKVLAGLDKLKNALNMRGAGKGLEDLNAAGRKIDLSHISRTLEDIRGRFSALSITAVAALTTITLKALQTGTALAKSLAVDPISQGFKEYELGLNSVQTILANTAAAGTTLKDVNKALAELNQYADQTIYNFGQMTRNIGTFTAAGVDLETATSAIKGISNLAAVSGSSAEQAANAMYQLSQALSSGRVTLMDWNSVVNAGMGGTVFQRALAQTAVKMGTLSESAVKLTGKMKNVTIEGESFRNSISAAPGKESWLTGDVLTATLQQLSGDLTDAELSAQGYTKAQIEAIQTQAKMALDAATQVKTLSQLLDTTKEAIGSGWAQTWQLIFGDFGEAKTLFTGLSNAISGFVSRSSHARNQVLKDWKDLGGRTLLISSLKNAFVALGDILAPIRDAFRDIFPRKTGQDLFDLTKRFAEFTQSLKPSQETVDNLRRTFRGLFALLDIGRDIIQGVFSIFGHMVGALDGGNGGFLNLTGSIGDFIVSVRDALESGNAIGKFFDGLGTILSKPVELISALAAAFGSLFGETSSKSLSGFSAALGPIQRVLSKIYETWVNFVASITGAEPNLEGISSRIGDLFSNLGKGIADAVRGIDWDNVLAIVNTGLFAGLVLLFKNFFGKGSFLSQIGGLDGGLLASITGSFKGLTGAFQGLTGVTQTMQNNIKAKTLKEIAIAIGILAASLFVLSTIEPKKLQNAMTAMTLAFGALIGAMKLLDIATKSAGFIRLPIIATGLIALAGAMVILSLAVKTLSSLSWEELSKGLIGVGALLVGVSAAAGPLSASSAGLIRAGIGIAALGVAMKILASAVKDFGGLSWTVLGKGMLSVASALVIVGGAARIFPKGMVAIGAGLVVVGAGLKIIASAVAQFGSMNLSTLGKGLGAIGAALVIIAGAVKLMPKTMLLQAAALVSVGIALNIIAKAVESMGGMSLEEIGKGLGALAGSLIILAAGLTAMSGAIGGAVALGITASGIALLVPALKVLGGMSIGQIIKSLLSLAGALGILGGASLLLQPAIPAMLGFGAALILIGGGLALAGTGIALIGVGLSSIAVAGPAAVAILVGALTSLMEKLPEFVRDVVEGLVALVKGIADAAPQFAASVVKIIGTLATTIVKVMPSIVKAFGAIIKGIAQALVENAPAVISAGLSLLMALLTGIRNNIAQVTTAVIQIITTFLGALADNIGDVIAAGLNLVVSIVKGIGNGLSKVVTAGADAVLQFAIGLGKNILKVVAAAGIIVLKFVEAIAKNAIKVATAGAEAVIKFAEGLGRNATKIVAAGAKAIIKFIEGLGSKALEVAKAGAQAVIDFINGLTTALEDEEYIQKLITAGFNLGIAIVKGVIKGLTDPLHVGDLINKAKGLAGKVTGAIGGALHLGSPSKVTETMGGYIVQGLAIGMEKNAPEAYKSAENMSRGIIETVEKIFEISSPSKVMTQLGRYIGQGLVNGLKESTENVNATFVDLNERFVNAMKLTRETLADQKEKLRKLQDADKKDADAIAAAQKAIKRNEELLDLTRAAHKELVKGLTSEKKELLGLAKDYETVTKKLDDARSVLEEAKKARDDFAASTSEQFAETPDIDLDSGDQLGQYMQDLANQVTAVTTFANTLEQLRKLGLSDRTYRKLIEDGTADQKFADQLLAGGTTAVQGLNTLDAQLDGAAKIFGANAATNLYQAGVDAAKGLIDGLESQKTEIAKKMTEIADTIVKALKKKLKIKSPSEVFAEVGNFAISGLAKGLEDSSKLVTDAAENIGSAAVDSMKKSMTGLATSLDFDNQPVITPVLDLSRIRQDARGMSDILNRTPLTASASYAQASAINTDQTTSEIDQLVAPGGTTLKFEQNNYSPEALPAIEIYRRTRNQLAQAQLALG